MAKGEKQTVVTTATSRASLLRAMRATGKSVISIKTLRKSTKTEVGKYKVVFRKKY